MIRTVLDQFDRPYVKEILDGLGDADREAFTEVLTNSGSRRNEPRTTRGRGFDQQDEEVGEKALSHQIDLWLAESRPERYSADEKDWMDSVIELRGAGNSRTARPPRRLFANWPDVGSTCARASPRRPRTESCATSGQPGSSPSGGAVTTTGGSSTSSSCISAVGRSPTYPLRGGHRRGLARVGTGIGPGERQAPGGRGDGPPGRSALFQSALTTQGVRATEDLSLNLSAPPAPA